ncbi:hypothetical protein DOY81_003485 [Sarcophaga bullata]|nr:hypothetical protein DOY81_003485 [Sarcophaga bullata]
MLATINGIAREEGVLKLWRGMTASIYRHMIYSGVRISTYDYLRKVLATQMEDGTNARLPIPLSTFCGLCAGCLAQWLSSPAALVKILLQMEGKRRLMGEAPRVHSVSHAFKYVVSKGGIKGLWRGSVPNVQRAALVNLGDLTSYDAVKEIIMNKTHIRDCLTLHILASIGAGFVAACMGTPAAVIKTRTMNQPIDDKGKGLLYKGSVDCFCQTVSKEGFTALYKGFLPLWIRLVPFALIFWVSFEKIHSCLGASGY